LLTGGGTKVVSLRSTKAGRSISAQETLRMKVMTLTR
jgi:hypothetical protein